MSADRMKDQAPPGYVWIYSTPPGLVDGGVRPLDRRELIPEAIWKEWLQEYLENLANEKERP